MKILFTSHQGGIAGSTFSTIYLAKGLASKDHEIHLACDPRSQLMTELKKDGRVYLHNLSFSGYFDLSSAKRLADIAKKHEINIVCPQGGVDRSLVIVAKWIYAMNAHLIFIRRQRPRNEPWIKRWIHVRATKKIVMVSHGLKRIFLDKGYPENHLDVIHNGVETNPFIKPLEATKTLKLKSELDLTDEVIIGCVSRKKYQEIIIESLRFLPEHYIVLFIGIEQNELAEVIKREQPKQRLIFLGLIPREQLRPYYRIMTLSILASKMDGFGLVLVEAMLSGVPVVASKFGGIPDVIENNKTGLLFENDDPLELAECISRLISQPHFREKIRANALKRAKTRFDVQKTVDAYEQLFFSILEEKS